MGPPAQGLGEQRSNCGLRPHTKPSVLKPRACPIHRAGQMDPLWQDLGTISLIFYDGTPSAKQFCFLDTR